MRKIFLFLAISALVFLAGYAIYRLAESPSIRRLPERTDPRTSSEALKACDSELQTSVIRPSTPIKWEESGISTCYRLQLTIDPTIQTLAGKSHITFTNTSGSSLSDIVFRLFPNSPLIYGGKMEIKQSIIEQQVVEPVYILDRTAISLLPSSPVKPNQTISIEIDFTLDLPSDFGSDRVYGIFNRSTKEKILTLANWYPLIPVHNNGKWDLAAVDGIGDAVTSQTALFLVDVKAPADWEVVTTGIELTTAVNAGFVTHSFVSGPARDFMVTVSPDFIFESRMVEDITIKQWGISDTKQGWNSSLDVAAQSMKTFNERYGAYPNRELDIVAVPLNLAIGVEYPGLILISSKDYQPNPEAQNELTVVVAHEVAHQWWYNIIGNDVSAYPWQDEGLTTFSTLDFLNTFNPGIYRYLENSYQQRIANLEQKSGKETFMQPVGNFINRPSVYSTLIYNKGALFFKAVKEKIGSKSFFSALRTYYMRNKYLIASPQELISVFPVECNCDLTSLYEEWGVDK